MRLRQSSFALDIYLPGFQHLTFNYGPQSTTVCVCVRGVCVCVSPLCLNFDLGLSQVRHKIRTHFSLSCQHAATATAQPYRSSDFIFSYRDYLIQLAAPPDSLPESVSASVSISVPESDDKRQIPTTIGRHIKC